MLFTKINDFTFISECNNYRIIISGAGAIDYFNPQRVTPSRHWLTIAEGGRQYHTWDEAKIRIGYIHKTEQKLEIFAVNRGLVLASRDVYNKARRAIDDYLS